MFDRIFNILRAEVGDMFGGQKNNLSDEEWEQFVRDQQRQQAEQDRAKQAEFEQQRRQQTEDARYYADLELKPGASFDEIKAAYKRLIKQYHPDRFHGDKAKQDTALQVTQRLNTAYAYFEKKFGK
jgi:preprotein translocase subunit Sec63